MRIRSVLTILTLSAAAACGQITAVNGASFLPGEPVSPGSFATVFGEGLCAGTAVGEWIGLGQLPVTLGGCSVQVKGVPAMLAFVSPAQVNFVVPEEAGMGRADIVITSGAKTTSGSLVIGRAGPGIFSMNGLGMGEAAVLHGKAWHRGPFSVTTAGQPTPVAIFVTGIDISTKPVVNIGGVPVDVLYWGPAPGFAGLQQINLMLPASLAGVGRVPLVVISGDKVSNVTYITILPTTEMTKGMPGQAGKGVRENERRGREISFMALNAANNTVLVTDEDDDSVRVISLDTGQTMATIALPDGSEPRHVAVNAAGTLAAAALTEKGAVVLIDLAANKVLSVLPTGVHPSHLVFNGTNLLVTNSGSASVVVVDTTAPAIARTVPVGAGPAGIAVSGDLAVVANMQAGSISIVGLDSANPAVITAPLPEGVRPQEVVFAGAKVVITTPLANAFYVLGISEAWPTTKVETGADAKGPGALAVHNNLVFIANQLSASVSVFDIGAGTLVKTFAVDPGPRALAVNAAKNQLLVLCQGTGTILVLDLTAHTLIKRLDAAETVKEGSWTLPAAISVAPPIAAAGSTVQIAITGTNLQVVQGLEFQIPGGNQGKGQGQGPMKEDSDIKVVKMGVNAAGTVLTAEVQVLAKAAPGARHVRLQTAKAEVAAGVFTITPAVPAGK